MQYCDILGQGRLFYQCEERLAHHEMCIELLHDVIKEADAFCLKDLKINGNDLLALGVPQGERIGSILSWLLSAVIDGYLPNEHEALLTYAKHLLVSDSQTPCAPL